MMITNEFDSAWQCFRSMEDILSIHEHSVLYDADLYTCFASNINIMKYLL